MIWNYKIRLSFNKKQYHLRSKTVSNNIYKKTSGIQLPSSSLLIRFLLQVHVKYISNSFSLSITINPINYKK